MDFSIWFALLILFVAGGLTPGPAVILVASSSLKFSFKPAMMAALGIAGANVLWASLATSGAAALASAYPNLFLALKLIGIAFIFWIALNMYTSAAPISLTPEDVPRRRVLFAKGVGLQLANPNALIYFGGLLPAYLDANRPMAPQFAIILVTVTATELIGLAIYAIAAERLAQKFQNPTFAILFNRIAAALMAGSALFALYISFFASSSTS